MDSLTVDPRYCGPPDIANGGYLAGLLSRGLPGAVAVTLRAPTPLGRPLRVVEEQGVRRVLDGEQPLAEAAPCELQLEVPEPVGFTEARMAAEGFIGFNGEFFPGCFVCGPDRKPGHGLRIFAGPVSGQQRVAAPWVPDPSLGDGAGSVRPEFLWAALDCPGAFAALVGQEPAVLLLGRMELEILAPVAVGQPCVVMGWPLTRDGRKHRVGTALYADGTLAAKARSTWVALR